MNSHDNLKPQLDDPRVIAALDEYVASLETGQKPDRQAFLARHAEVADALTECLDGMEALHEASSAPRQPAGGLATPMDWQPGTPLGDFRILREIGRGGMGVVYEAEQLSLGRRIALKVLPFALTLDPRQLQRFKNEARAAAQLHHQHIVPVYYVGSERGVHFYAMQYIEGQSLAEVILGLRQLAGDSVVGHRPSAIGHRPSAIGHRPSAIGQSGKPVADSRQPTADRWLSRGESTGPFVPRSESTAAETAADPVGALATAYSTNSTHFYRSVARLGAQAAEALEHAHEYGVVHRDIKPGNLLVDGHGHVWVADFGLAQFQSEAGLTQSGDLLGTLRYMSPEQANGKRVLLDHRTDVYSLGATLYELLTLRPTFDGADRQTLLRQILHDEPRPPRAIQKSIPVELETIVLKCLEKDPGRRYATARDLADDLQRFLDYQPIRARRPTAAQRVRKWARRHPSIVVAGVVLCVLTAAGSLVSAAMVQGEQAKTQAAYDMVRGEQAKTQAAYERELQRAKEAEERFLLAKEWVDDMFNVCEEELAGQPQFDGLRRRLLENTLAYYQKLIEQRRGAPDARGRLAANLERVQQILDDLAVLQGDKQLPLLSEPAVLDDLHLQGEERQQIAELARSAGDLRSELFQKKLSPEERRQGFVALARSNETKVEKILTRQQLSRLRQIALQQQGPWAFEEPEVTAALKLTARQREQIRAIGVEAFFTLLARHHGRGGPRKGPDPARPPNMSDGKRRTATENPAKATEPKLSPVERIIKEVLTAEQASRWQELTGAPFKGLARRWPERMGGPFKGPPRGHPGPWPDRPDPRP